MRTSIYSSYLGKVGNTAEGKGERNEILTFRSGCSGLRLQHRETLNSPPPTDNYKWKSFL